ncbi:hypothetical protein BDQ12DRAFT_406951 [Crucibulum laeve]|uniref:Uncharacterized protein n=1 Tax=Crucibulum laeve TaxID=68775 RepID=A0A5C3LLJ2_9AGAR|nr:hypothetical protein BDQ12DRAFT_406951 [Crucibulum laeve]
MDGDKEKSLMNSHWTSFFYSSTTVLLVAILSAKTSEKLASSCHRNVNFSTPHRSLFLSPNHQSHRDSKLQAF